VCSKALGASADGTCTVAKAGYPGNPACGNGFACDGTSASCPGAQCVSDIDCLPTDYCAANGSCQPQKTRGAACSLMADCKTSGACRACQTGFCVDGVCCDTACNTLCQACAAALKQSGADGACGPAKDDTNPHKDACPMQPAASCGPDGMCDGNGACRMYWPFGTSCGQSQCNTQTNGVIGSACDGLGTCKQTNGASCSPYLCTNGTCPNACTLDTDCVPSAYCSPSGTCQSKKPGAAPCTSGRECAMGFCVDGVCCDRTCQGQCEACDVANNVGTCSSVLSGPPHGARAACTGVGLACGGECRGSSAACTYPPQGTACGSTCTNALATVSTCDGAGKCSASAAQACAGNLQCDATTGKCKTACATDADCTGGFVCGADHTCGARGGATCDGDHVVKNPGGADVDCAPYKCDGPRCRGNCASVADCVSPNICDTTGHCVAAPSQTSGDSGGCALAPGNASSGGAASALAVVLALAVRRKRRVVAP
jgi:hypothetical protein